jgi:hypothetical protein
MPTNPQHLLCHRGIEPSCGVRLMWRRVSIFAEGFDLRRRRTCAAAMAWCASACLLFFSR